MFKKFRGKNILINHYKRKTVSSERSKREARKNHDFKTLKNGQNTCYNPNIFSPNYGIPWLSWYLKFPWPICKIHWPWRKIKFPWPVATLMYVTLDLLNSYTGSVCCCCLFGFNVAFNNFSVISERWLVATGSSMLTFIVLPHWSIMPQTLDLIPHPVTLSRHLVNQS